MSNTEQLDLNKIRTDGGTQPRTRLYEDVVSEYREAVEDDAEFPPVTVFHDGSAYWLADGFHRFHAHKQAGKTVISAEIHQGARRDAVLYSVGANGDHGVRRTNEDKRNAVMALLNDEEWARWSDREIARQCGVSDRTVNRVRGDLTATMSHSGNKKTYTTRHGTEATMNTANIGRTENHGKDEGAEPEIIYEKEEELTEENQGQPRSRGVGVRLAHEAIAVLRRIPLDDGLRQDAFDIVQDWIETNRGN